MSKPKLVIRLLVTWTLIAVAIAAAAVVYWRFVERPWTRDGMVKADVVEIAPEVMGKVIEVFVEDNQLVSEGDLLFTIDARTFAIDVQKARIAIDQARQQVAAMEADVVAAEAAVVAARAGIETAESNVEANRARVNSAHQGVAGAKATLASADAAVRGQEAALQESISERDRALRLAEQKAGSVEEAQAKTAAAKEATAGLDAAVADRQGDETGVAQSEAGLAEAEAELTVASAQLAESEADLASAIAGLEQARAKLGAPGDENVSVRQAVASLAEAELKLEKTRLLAPASGYVINVNVDPGDFAFPGIPMLAFVDRETFHVEAYFKETQLRHVAAGDRMVITLMAHPDEPLAGTVESIGRAISPPDIATTEGLSGLVPQVEPTFDWIRLAQRVPVRVHFEHVPDGIELISGTTASIGVEAGALD